MTMFAGDLYEMIEWGTKQPIRGYSITRTSLGI